MSSSRSKEAKKIEFIKGVIGCGIRAGVEVVEKSTSGAGRKTGFDVTLGRTAKKILDQKK